MTGEPGIVAQMMDGGGREALARLRDSYSFLIVV